MTFDSCPLQRVLLAGLLSLGLLFAGGEAKAACGDDPNIGKVSPALADIECKKVDVTTFQGGNTGVPIITYQDVKMPEASAKIFREAIKEASVKAMGAYVALSSKLKFYSIEFVISPKAFIGGEEAVPRTHGLNSDTCIITVNGDVNVQKMEGGGLAKDTPSLYGETYKHTIAHEIVHCFQDWNFTGQMTASGSTWWREGTAEYLADTLYPFATPSRNKMVKQFDKDSATKPLTQMTYETLVFFSWLGQTHGKKAIFDFMAAMPKSNGETPQRDALLSFVSVDDIQKFATDYLDGTIKGPRMESIGNPDLGTMQQISGTTEKKFTGKPFTIMRGQFTIKDGDYDIATHSSAEPEPQFSKTQGPWKGMDASVEAACSSPPSYRYAAFITGNKELTTTVSAELTKSNKECTACADLGKRDKCLIGRWAMDDDSLASFFELAWDEKPGPLVLGDGVFEFRDNGQMTLTFDKLDITAFYKVSETKVVANGNQTGTWSSGPGTLRVCPVTDTVKFDVTVRIFYPKDFTTKQSVNSQAGNEDFQFNCSGNAMMMSHPSAKVNGKQVIWHLTKLK